MILCGLICCACRTQPSSTRLTVADFELISTEIAARLRQSDFLTDRTPQSKRLILTVESVTNLSTDLLSEVEKWYLVDRVLDAPTMRSLGQSKNIGFVIPIEKLHLFKEHVNETANIARNRQPTHVMRTVLRSISRTAGADRTDLYDVEFKIVAIPKGQLVWSDHFALKRIARGKAYN